MTFDTTFTYALVIAAAFFLARPALRSVMPSNRLREVADHPLCETNGHVGGCGGGCISCPVANRSAEQAKSLRGF